MKIVVCVKQVPESSAPVAVEEGSVTWKDAPLVVNPWDEFAIEAALTQKELQGGSVTAVCVGAESAQEALRYALAMGCDEAVLINDPFLEQIDSQALSSVLAAAIRKIGEVDLVILGRQAIDTDMGVTAPQVARRLQWPVLTSVSEIHSIDEAARKIQVVRTFEESRQLIESSLPLVVGVLKDIGEPRYPSFMGIRRSQKAVITTWSKNDLGLAPMDPTVTVLEITSPAHPPGVAERITGATPAEIAEKLAEKILAERVS